jgi:hypothetical protein
LLDALFGFGFWNNSVGFLPTVRLITKEVLPDRLPFVRVHSLISLLFCPIMTTPDSGALPDPDAVHENHWYNQDFDGYRISEHPLFARRPIRMICVGAGATGLQIAYKAERVLKDVELQIYEKNSDVGGTWLENRYPGCTCDIPSHS